MTATKTEITSVSVDTMVDVPIEHAFRVFTERIDDWWEPGHHLLDSELETMTFEPRGGGSIVDKYVDGRELKWARVLAFDPPNRLVFSWDISVDWKPSSDYDKSSEVEVTFTSMSPDKTHVVLTHRNLDRHGDGWQALRDAVGQGWTLARYAEVATA